MDNTPGLSYVTYDGCLQDTDPRPAIFLAGPTTDQWFYGRARIGARSFSFWRGVLIGFLYRGGFRGTVIVPEFANKTAGFEPQAQARWGQTMVPDGVPVRPRSWGVYHWEIEHLIAADLRVAWADCRDSGAGVGLNARPEIQGLLEQYIAQLEDRRKHGVPVQRLVLGISPDCTGKTRFEALAYKAGIKPARTIAELAEQVLEQVQP